MGRQSESFGTCMHVILMDFYPGDVPGTHLWGCTVFLQMRLDAVILLCMEDEGHAPEDHQWPKALSYCCPKGIVFGHVIDHIFTLHACAEI